MLIWKNKVSPPLSSEGGNEFLAQFTFFNKTMNTMQEIQRPFIEEVERFETFYDDAERQGDESAMASYERRIEEANRQMERAIANFTS